MASFSNLPAPANDLRSEAKEYQRDRNHNAKWARGFAPAMQKRCAHTLLTVEHDACSECAVKPQHRDYSRRCGRHFQPKERKLSAHSATMARKVFRSEVVDATDNSLAGACDSSEEDDIREASSTPAADADIMYSYDVTDGPGRGTDLLSHAVTQAVHRYENKMTEKLVREYEFVDVKDNNYDSAADADEDDFQVIDHSHAE